MELQAAIYGERFAKLAQGIRELFVNQPGLAELADSLERELNDFEQRGFLSVAFIGEYSAGKSTIIAAMTHRRDIHISADIATDRTTEYPWNGLHLIDTPGLCTQHKHHDAITNDAIRTADLLVYCLTHTLFDQITLGNFRDLAFDKNFQKKMFLVVNKMSKESGNDETKIANYSTSLDQSLRPEGLGRFPVFYIDALDYIEGVDGREDDLVQMSRIGIFVEGLNEFVAAKGALARLDTPLRILIGHLDRASDHTLRNDTEDDVYSEILTRINRSAERNRASLRGAVDNKLQGLRSQICKMGRDIADLIGTEEMTGGELAEAQRKITGLGDQLQSQLQALVDETAANLAADLDRELDSPLLAAYIERLDASFSSKLPGVSTSAAEIKSRLSQILKVSTTAGVPIKKLLDVPAAGSKLAAVGGKPIHQGVLWAGKVAGVKFKPWQATKIAKNVGKGIALLGIALEIVSALSDAAAEAEADENLRKVAAAKRDLVNEFQDMASDIDEQFRENLRQTEQQLFGQTVKWVAEARDEHERNVSGSNTTIGRIVVLRAEANQLLTSIA